MKPRPLSAIRADAVTASLDRDHERLEHLLAEGIEHPRGGREFLPRLARLYGDLGRDDEAASLWRRAFAAVPDLENACHLLRQDAEAAYAARRWLEETMPGAAGLLDDLIPHLPDRPPKPCRHVAICGVSYCGSTVLGRLLDGLDGVHDIGESHWLIEQRLAVDGRRDIDFLAPTFSPSTMFCRQCGDACTVLTKTFRFGLQVDRRHWYGRIAERVGTGILVSSDKNLRKYTRLDPKLRFDAIVLFKSPIDAWHSFRKRLSIEASHEEVKALDAFIASWTRQYDDALRLRPEGRKLFLHFDRLVAAPDEILARLVEVLDLPRHCPGAVSLTAGKHAIGGNEGFFERRQDTDRPAMRRLETPKIPDDHARRIAEDVTICRIRDEMLSQSDALFGRS